MQPCHADVGIVIPVYKGRRFLRDCLDSIQEQSPDITRTTVVVEDGTPAGDDAADIVAAYPDVRYEALGINRGVFFARWHGARMLGDVRYLAFLDQDDAWRPDFLARTVGVLDTHPRAVMAVTNAEMHTATGPYTLYRFGTPSITLADLKWVNTIIAPGQVLMRRETWETAHITPDLEAPGADDWLTWLALLAAGGEGIYVPEILIDYREHAAGAHNWVNMRNSERAVVRQWFPRLGLSRWDQRCYEGRVALDALRGARHRKSVRQGLQALFAAAHDPAAFVAAIRERKRRLQNRIV